MPLSGPLILSFESLMNSHLFAASIILALYVVPGCGGPSLPPPIDKVTGTITAGGKPVADAEVTFYAMEGLPAKERTKTAKTDAAGKFSLSQVYPAEYMVRVSQAKPADPSKAPAVADAGPLKKYSGDSPLRAKVSKDATDFPFDL
jgi:hypothetical protein